MRTRRARARRLALIVSLMLWRFTPGLQAAERELHWDALDVDARFDANGVLDVIERHTMVFTGDWNGGERIFNVGPRQKLEFLGMERVDAKTGLRQPLHEALVPGDIDEFTWAGARTLRWRSRRPSDPPFASTRLIYVLRYKLSRILLKDDEQYRIDHDFAFPKRPGSIASFSLGLVLDPVWQPLGELRDRYTAGPLAPGQSFVLTIPLRYSGTGSPAAIDVGRPQETVWAVTAIVAMFAFIVLGFFAHERSLGRFARLDTLHIDSAWIETNILSHPAEVVGAAWDGRIGTPEVVALIARMTAEGTLESEVEGKDSMTLRLKVDRSKLDGHERALVDGLFFDDRTETSTKAVQQHYKSKGFDPVTAITPQLAKHVKTVLPSGDVRVGRFAGLALFLAGAALLVWGASGDPYWWQAVFGAVIASVFLGGLLQIPAWLFRSRMDWGQVAAALFMIPALFVSLGAAAFLWLAAGRIELPWTMIGGIAAWATCISFASINGMKSRQSRDAIAFRKRLATGRSFFLQELGKATPDLRDGWYPWLLAFGLGKQVDVWSTHHSTAATGSSPWGQSTPTLSASSASSTPPGFTGGGGRSGGAGASGAWAAAAAGMATGVAAPDSSSSSSGGGRSSSGGSSGGGGGGGW